MFIFEKIYCPLLLAFVVINKTITIMSSNIYMILVQILSIVLFDFTIL